MEKSTEYNINTSNINSSIIKENVKLTINYISVNCDQKYVL